MSVSGISISGTDAGNYSLSNTTATTTASITKLAVTVSITANDKTYDGSTIATVKSYALTGKLSGDDLSLTNVTGAFSDKNAGSGKTVTFTGYTLAGAAADNYSISNSQTTTTASISPAPLHVTATGISRTYDGTSSATVSLSDDHLGSDNVVVAYAANFSDRNAGDNKQVSVSLTGLSGNDAANYTLASTSITTTATINQRPITVTAVTDSRAYDGTAASSATPSPSPGSIVTGDSAMFTQAFDSPTVGSGKTLTPSGFVNDGNSGLNYSYTFDPISTGAITAKPLLASFTAESRTYDGTTAATVTGTSLTGVIGKDAVTLTVASATFSDKNVGDGKTVTGSGFGLTGAQAGNYSIGSVDTTTAAITARDLTVTATADNKTYDGTATAVVQLSDNHLDGDTVTDAYTSANFGSASVGTGKTVTVSGISIGGADAGNYNLTNTVATTTADIGAQTVKVSFVPEDKTYDGTQGATFESYTFTGAVSGDELSLTDVTGEFATRNVGAQDVTFSGYQLSGAAKGNYALSNTTYTTTASISARPIKVTAVTDTKTYDGTTAASDPTVVPTITGGLGAGDTAGFAQSFADPNAADTVTTVPSGEVNDGNDGNNYTVTFVDGTGSITPRHVTGSFTTPGKTYDGSTAATVNDPTLSNTVAGDAVTLVPGTATFASRNVGSWTVTPNEDFTLGGTKAGNYVLDSVDTTTASISARPIKVTAVTDTKTYDGTTHSDVPPQVTDGELVGNDTALLSQTFDSKNAGSRTLTPAIAITDGNGGNNYAVTTVPTGGTISPLGITGAFTAANKTYDGTTAATITGRSLTGTITGDTVAMSGGSATFGDKNADTGKTVTGTGFTLTGGDAPNYTLKSTTLTTYANIAPAALTITVNNASMVSGSNASPYSVSYSPFVTGEDPSVLSGTLTFQVSDGQGSPVTVGPSTPAGTYTITAGGLASNNYAISWVPGTLTVTMRIDGFYQPVDMTPSGAAPIWNIVKNGSTVPLKFRVYSGQNQVTTTAGMSVNYYNVSCVTGITGDTITSTASATGGTVLRYDSTSGQFIFNWTVPSGANKCYQATVTASDGITLPGAYFKTK